MYWDKYAKLYDLFENISNKKVNDKMSNIISNEINKEDIVLECACGTGIITEKIIDKCKYLVASDYSLGMLEVIKKK